MINSVNRKEAIKKMGKYATLTALSSFLILTPLSSQSNSPGDCDNKKTFLTNWRCKKNK